MMLRDLRLATIVAVGLGIAGCASTPRLYSSQNPAADLSSYQTYGYVQQMGTDVPGGPATLLTQFLKAAVDREMQAHGYRFSEQSGDLLVNFYVETQEQIQTRTTPASGASIGYGYYGYRGGAYRTWGGYSETEITQYTEGTLNIDIVDPQRGELVWEGVAIGRITEEARRNMRAAIDGVVPQIFEQYPYNPGP
jgi:hypothetical protein